MQGLPDSFLQEGFVLNDGLHLQRHIADNHRQREILHRAGAGNGLAPLSFGVGAAVQDALEHLTGDIGIVLAAGGDGQLGKSHTRKGIGKNIVRGDDGFSLAREREIKVVMAVVAILFQKFRPLHGTGKPVRILLHLIIQHGEHPDLPALQPDELVGIKDTAVPVQAGEIPPILQVL